MFEEQKNKKQINKVDAIRLDVVRKEHAQLDRGI